MTRVEPYLWERLTSFGNLYAAWRKAARGRRGRASVGGFERDLEINLPELRSDLIEGRYQPGSYVSFHIHDPKKRLISAAPFRDRVVHHALVNVIEPIFERKFIYDTYANRLGKGTHRALDCATRFLRHYRYVLPLDVRQFFPSIDHTVLLSLLEGVIADIRILELCRRIIASGKGVLKDEYEMAWFPGDDLLAATRLRGLPIGNLTSQFWANVYLNGLDHFIKRELKCHAYLRYVDDMLLFADDKSDLHAWRKEIISYLESLRLSLHENSAQPRPCETGLPFLGFQVFPDHRRLKRRKAIHARRRLKLLAARYQAGLISDEKAKACVLAWVNHASHGDTWGLRRAMFSQIHFRRLHGGTIETITHFQQNV
jgi:RNA-directed DNA polymerase